MDQGSGMHEADPPGPREMLFALLTGIVTVPVSRTASPARRPLATSRWGIPSTSSTPDGWVALFVRCLAQAFGARWTCTFGP